MAYLSFLLAALVVALSSPVVLSWGGQGHIATAWLAQSLFHPFASELTTDLLPDYKGNIASIASWADEVRNSGNTPYYPWSSPWHYVNTPQYVCQYNVSLCPREGCVDSAVHNYTVRSLNASLPTLQRREALEFLVHFIGDLHQPLHAGFSSDSGGNGISVRFNNATRPSNLHSVWDSGLISYRVATNFANNYTAWNAHLQQLMHTTYQSNLDQWRQCPSGNPFPCSGDWVQESSTYCCSTVYLDDDKERMYPGPNLTYSLSVERYYQRNIDLLEMRIIQAGVRMAFVLNAVAQTVYADASSSSSGAAMASSSSSDIASSSSTGVGASTAAVMASSSSSAHSEASTGASSSTGSVVVPTGSYTSAATGDNSSTGSGADEEESSVVMAFLVVLVILALVLAVVGFLFWRKRKYGLSGLCDSVDSRPNRARLMEEEDTTAGYTRVV